MNERGAEAVAYVVAAVILIVGGAVFETMILNWFVGPMIVVITVWLLTPLLGRRRAR
jgi:hypothetical protein